MSEVDKFKKIIQEIKEIFLLLTQGEPTPDDEIGARVSLMDSIQNLKKVDAPQVGDNLQLFEETFIKLEDWDTLELWFTESELPDAIQKIISITEAMPELEEHSKVEATPSTETVSKSKSPEIDIDEIVDQVSDKFKGEIDDLKQKVEFLKHELEVKDETLKKVSQKRVIKKITPKRESKLPPPEIRIPQIKKPEIAPKLVDRREPEKEKAKEKIGVKSMEDVQAKIELEIEKLQPIPPVEEKPKIYDEMQEEAKSVLNILEELEPTPSLIQTSVIEDDFLSLEDKDTEMLKVEIDLHEGKADEAGKSLISTNVSVIEEESSEAGKVTPFLSTKPKISAVRVEEIETDDIKSSGKELFNVFSSVGNKTEDIASTIVELPQIEPGKQKKKKESKKKKNAAEKMTFIEFGAKESSTSDIDVPSAIDTEELPTDKDSLYQELIALEGKRYSLEKNFKDIEKSYNMGSINETEYKNHSEELKYNLDKITSQINRIRRVIASM